MQTGDLHQNIFGVKGLDPSKHVNHTIGSKPGLAMAPAIFINPSNITLMTVPGYPVMGTHTQYLGGEVVNLPLTEANNFLPDLKSIDKETRAKAKILYLNYPNNQLQYSCISSGSGLTIGSSVCAMSSRT